MVGMLRGFGWDGECLRGGEICGWDRLHMCIVFFCFLFFFALENVLYGVVFDLNFFASC